MGINNSPLWSKGLQSSGDLMTDTLGQMTQQQSSFNPGALSPANPVQPQPEQPGASDNAGTALVGWKTTEQGIPLAGPQYDDPVQNEQIQKLQFKIQQLNQQIAAEKSQGENTNWTNVKMLTEQLEGLYDNLHTWQALNV